jgi:hypothetical protein
MSGSWPGTWRARPAGTCALILSSLTWTRQNRQLLQPLGPAYSVVPQAPIPDDRAPGLGRYPGQDRVGFTFRESGTV